MFYKLSLLTLFMLLCILRGDAEPLAAGEHQPAGVLHNQRWRRAAGRGLLEGQRLHQLHLQQRHHSVFLSALSRCQLQGARVTQGPVLPTLSRWVFRCVSLKSLCFSPLKINIIWNSKGSLCKTSTNLKCSANPTSLFFYNKWYHFNKAPPAVRKVLIQNATCEKEGVTEAMPVSRLNVYVFVR